MKNKTLLIYILISLLVTISVSAQDVDISTKKRAAFIIKMANSIRYSNDAKYKDYKIGIFGNSRELRNLHKELISQAPKTNIENKLVKVFQFKRISRIEPVDLLYITGDSKIRLSSLNQKLKGRPYILLTEDFPFGASALNFTINKKNNLYFELQEAALENKGIKISSEITNSKERVYTEKEWQNKLSAALNTIKEKEATIEDQNITIEENAEVIETKSKVITYLTIIIVLICVSLIVITALVVMLIKSNKQRKKNLKKIKNSINYSKRIQKAIVYKDSKYEKYFDNHFIIQKPKDIVSGDFYWIYHEENKIFFLVADCTGHGVPGAMLSLICHNILRRSIKEFKISQPAAILDKTTELLKNIFSEEEHVRDGMDIALCCLHLDSDKLEFAGANNPLYYIHDNEMQIIKGDKQSIGMFESDKPFTNKTLNYKKGDTFYLFSDGYADQFGGEKSKKFHYSNFRNLLTKNSQLSMSEQKDVLIAEFEQWKGEGEQTDDVCVMGVKI